MLEVNNILRPCLYKLKNKGVIVYIGYTDNYYKRIAQHIDGSKIFDTFSLEFFVTALDAINAEKEQIKKYKPVYNKVFNNNKKVSKDIINITNKQHVSMRLQGISYSVVTEYTLDDKYRFDEGNLKIGYTISKEGIIKGAVICSFVIYYFSGKGKGMKLKRYK